MPLPLILPQRIAPTDNLYKFLSLFGLSLLVVAIVVSAIRTYHYNESVAKAYVAASLAAQTHRANEADVQRTVERIKAIQADLQIAKAELQVVATRPAGDPAMLANQTLAKASTSLDQATYLADQLPKRWEEERSLQLENVQRQAELPIAKKDVDESNNALIVVEFLAFIVSVCGFTGWYFRLQQPYDQLLRARVQHRLQELKERKTKSV